MKREACFAVFISAFAKALAGAVYVAAGGTGDGSSWESALPSVKEGYELAAQNAPSEVRIAGGVYLISEPIELKDNIKVTGGFGGETILSGDVNQNGIWSETRDRPMAGNYVVSDGAVNLPPIPEDILSTYICAYFSNPADDADTANAFYSDGSSPSANCGFKNLTFVLFKNAAIFVRSASSDGLVVDGCRFYANNTKGIRASNSISPAALVVSGSSATVRNSLFRFNTGSARFEANEETDPKEFLVEDCRFEGGVGQQSYASPQCGIAGGVAALGYGKITVRRCVFEKCSAREGNANGHRQNAGGLAVDFKGPQGSVSLVEDTLFSGNAITTPYACAGALYNIASGGASLHVRGSSFIGNKCFIPSSIRPAAAAIQCGMQDTLPMEHSSILVENSYFAGNTVTNTFVSSNNTLGAVYGGYGSPRAVFLNCVFENNLAIFPNAQNLTSQGVFGIAPGAKTAFIHSLMRENDCFVTNMQRSAEIGRNNVYNSSDYSIVNTVMTHSSGDYVPISEPFLSQRGAVIGGSSIKNFSWGDDASLFTHQNVTDYAVYFPSAREKESVLFHPAGKRVGDALFPALHSSSSLRGTGLPVYLSSTGIYCVLSTTPPYSAQKPVVDLLKHQAKYTLDEAGMDESAAPLCDALSRRRRPGKIDPGPLSMPAIGTQLFVR